MKRIERLSKSQFLKGIQCPKALWLYRRRPELIPEITEAQQQLFDTGHEIGLLAQQCFDGGIEIAEEYYLIDKAVASTRQAIENGQTTLFEASACSPDGAYARIDILDKTRGDRWDLIEVKGSTKVKDYHIDDMALQRYAFTGAGYDIRKSVLMHINNQYIRNGAIDVKQLFSLEDRTEVVEDRMVAVAAELRQLLVQVNAAEEPDIAIGGQCSSPFECDFKEYCWQHVPEYSVYDIFSGRKLANLLQRGIIDVADIPDDFAATKLQRIAIDAYQSKQIHVEKEAIRAFLSRLAYPLYYLDYETVYPAVPLFDNSRPYQQIPFQFSLHVQPKKGASARHVEFLHTDKGDPRPAFIENLVGSCSNEGSVVVYNQDFESKINEGLAAAFPEYAVGLENINRRMVDLLEPFRARHLYHPDMKGSASLKSVLPAFVPDMSYDGLAVSDGDEASRTYMSWLKGEIPEDEQQVVFANLEEYCGQDTLAEVRLIKVLERFAQPDQQ